MLRSEIWDFDPKVAIAPVVAVDSTALVSNIIDVQDAGALTFLIALGTLADVDATFAVTMDHGDVSNLSDAAAVTAADLVGETSAAGVTTATALANASFTFAADNLCRKIGYVGVKRYVRLTITPTGNAGNAPISAIALRSFLSSKPSSNPPA